MAKKPFTVVLVPDDGGYQVMVPQFPNCVAWGQTPQEAFANAAETLQSILEHEAESGGVGVDDSVHASHVIVGEVMVDVPKTLLEHTKVKAKVTAR